MTITPDLLQHASVLWLVSAGLALGVLHALEPGHAKTMMASFIVATRGTVPQAILLGLSAAISHSALIWILAPIGLCLGNSFIGDDVGPWIEVGSGALIVLIGLRMASRLGWGGDASQRFGPKGGRVIEIGGRLLELTVYEEDTPPEFRLFFYDRRMRPVAPAPAGDVRLLTVRPDGARRDFRLKLAGDGLVSLESIPEPHEFTAVLMLSQGGEVVKREVVFVEHDHHHDTAGDHRHPHVHSHDDEDAHARAHADAIARRVGNQPVSNAEVALFGLGSGLTPCPAALTMLLVCLQLNRFALGVGVVMAFSLGLAIMLVLLGVIAAVGTAHASRRLASFAPLLKVLPYLSSALVVATGVYVAVPGMTRLV